MEKKDWRWRLYKLLVYIDVDCGEQELGFAIGIEGVEKLEKLVERELEKAREEGSFTIEELEVIRELCNFEYEKYVALDLEDSKAVKEVGILKSILSKLKQ